MNLLQQRAQKELLDFPLLTELEQGGKAWSADDVAQLDVNHDPEVDEVLEAIPDTWVCEHDEALFIAENAEKTLVFKETLSGSTPAADEPLVD